MGAASRRQPLYDQLVDLLREKIETELSPGDLLPSERELGERYGLSRTTVRLALKELEGLGLIVRRHGKGTFVADISQDAANLTSAYSFSEQQREMGRVPRTQILEFELTEAPKAVAQSLGLGLGDSVYKIRFLRLSDEVPMMVEVTYLPARVFLGLTREAVGSQSLYTLMEKDYGLTIKVAEEEFYASISRASESSELGIAEDSPVLRLVRTTYNSGNRAVEFTQSVARADQFKYRVLHVRS